MASPVRRSIRGAPLSASKPAAPASSTSSSSLASARQDRAARAKETSHPRSLSSEDGDDGPPRRSQRAHKDEHTKEKDVENEEDVAEEEEVTRCICGLSEYPGPPLESDAFAEVPNAQAEDAGGFFVCCDGCSVWQHGGCAGIADENIVNGNFKYMCEQCRPKLHELHTDSKGQKYSLYLPLHPKTQRKGSMSNKEEDKTKKPNARASVDPSTGRRRGTTRSKEHDDEEEQLKRAIEESKREAEGAGGNGRRTKRGRDESEDRKPATKRQRTASESLPSATRTASVADESEDEGETAASRSKKAKAEAAQTARQVEQQEKDKEREKARAEAAGRRQERAGRRRGDEAETTEDSTPKPTPMTSPPPPASSPPPTPPLTEKSALRKGPGKKIKKLGNNQYTRHRADTTASSPHGRRRQLATNSGDEAGDTLAQGDNGSNSGGTSKTSPAAVGAYEMVNGNGRGKFGKGKKAAAMNGNSIRSAPGEEVEKTFSNMKSAVDMMSVWVAKQQIEPVSASASEPASARTDGSLVLTGGAVQPAATPVEVEEVDRPFEEMSLEQMAASLQSGFKTWNERFAQFAQPA